ncbi:hypothetical protein B0T11DRAFT_354555 [Plectosphaerella cucumerina]|uniref:Uncharacterized protein n=1 Tax=Plectosphaerella cucumerina TaxID=40658 RepID=A0A8K0TG23_9PEZI|nr:hypothetical protein B0T11DRAFT_354555 [Plectosphaerella cucumerina]
MSAVARDSDPVELPLPGLGGGYAGKSNVLVPGAPHTGLGNAGSLAGQRAKAEMDLVESRSSQCLSDVRQVMACLSGWRCIVSRARSVPMGVADRSTPPSPCCIDEAPPSHGIKAGCRSGYREGFGRRGTGRQARGPMRARDFCDLIAMSQLRYSYAGSKSVAFNTPSNILLTPGSSLLVRLKPADMPRLPNADETQQLVRGDPGRAESSPTLPLPVAGSSKHRQARPGPASLTKDAGGDDVPVITAENQVPRQRTAGSEALGRHGMHTDSS